MTRKIVLELTDDEIEKLEEMVIFGQDKGPAGMGWASDLLCELREKLEKAIEEKVNDTKDNI